MRTTISIQNEDVLKRFVNFTNRFDSNVNLYKGSYCVDAKSILGVILLGMCDDLEVEIITHDENELVDFIRGVEEYEKEKTYERI